MNTSEHLDLRGLPVSERPEKVFDRFDRLTMGQAFTFVVDNEPRGLTNILGERGRQQIVVDRRRMNDREWHVTVRRTPAHAIEGPSPRNVLARTPAFADLDAPSLDRLAAAAVMHTSRRGHVLAPGNTDWPNLGIVFDGICCVSNDAPNSRYRIFYEIYPFEIFGEMPLFDGAQTPGRTIVLSKTARYLRIPHDVVLAVAAEHPELLRRIGAVVTQRARDMMVALTSQATTPVIARIAAVLLPYAVPEAGLSPALPPLPNLTQAHIAAAAGTVKEVAARAIAELEARGHLQRERGHIRFLNRQLLIDLMRENA